jgi:hypothetical protein
LNFKAITDLDPSIRKLLPIRTLLFFGAPHNGLDTEALASLVKGQPTATLINELTHDSPTLDSLSRRFKFFTENLSIHSYYESRPTKTVVEVPLPYHSLSNVSSPANHENRMLTESGRDVDPPK